MDREDSSTKDCLEKRVLVMRKNCFILLKIVTKSKKKIMQKNLKKKDSPNFFYQRLLKGDRVSHLKHLSKLLIYCSAPINNLLAVSVRLDLFKAFVHIG